MPSTTINWDNVSTHVQDYIMPRVRNNVFKANVAWYRMKDRVEHYAGGRKIVYPLAFEPEGGGGTWWNSNDKMDTRHRAPFTAAEYYAVNGVVPVTILQEEEDMVRGPEQVMSLVASKMKLANRTAISLLGGSSGLFSDGTNTKALAGLEKALPDVPATLHTYGGIPASSTQNTWWLPLADATAYTTGVAGNFVQGANWAPFDKAWANIGLNSDGMSPSLVLLNWGAFNDVSAACTKLDSSFRPQQDTDLRKAGFVNITYKNAVVVVDPNVPRNESTKVEKAYFLTEESFNLVVHELRDLDFVPWREPVDQFLRVAYILWRGQLCFSERRCNLKMTNITTTATSP
jgi:hypothetical protein